MTKDNLNLSPEDISKLIEENASLTKKLIMAEHFVEYALRHTYPKRAKSTGYDEVYRMLHYHPFATIHHYNKESKKNDEYGGKIDLNSSSSTSEKDLYAVLDAISDWPKLPSNRVLCLLGCFSINKNDHETGKAIQSKLPLGRIDYKTECEYGAGVWDRITCGAWIASEPDFDKK